MVPSVLVLVGLRERGTLLGFNGEETNPGESGREVGRLEDPSARSLPFERRRECVSGVGGDGKGERERPPWETS